MFQTISRTTSKMAFAIPFRHINGLADIASVGGKAASLSEMVRTCDELGVRVPDGFAVTVAAYKEFLHHNKMESMIDKVVREIRTDDVASLRRGGEAIRNLFCKSPIPTTVERAIAKCYSEMDLNDVAVRSSATLEDTEEASFAGQQETYLHINGIDAVLVAIRKCFASLYTDRAIAYRKEKGFGSKVNDVQLAVAVQKMVRSDLAASGVSFSIDPDSGFRDTVVVNAANGLGELVVGGDVVPDEFVIFKPTGTIIRKRCGDKHERLVYDGDILMRKRNGISMRRQYCIDDAHALEIAHATMSLERHYGRSVDVEWAIDGNDDKLYIVQARPETVHRGGGNGSRDTAAVFSQWSFVTQPSEKDVLTNGIAVGNGVGTGTTRVILDVASIADAQFDNGDVLVTEMTTPDWEPLMRRASAIITNRGGRTCHAAIVAREMGLPAIVGCGDATSAVPDRSVVTASCIGEDGVGRVFGGAFEVERKEVRVSHSSPSSPSLLEQKLMLNIASPDAAVKWHSLPTAGVGLARLEFIINNMIGIHPLALLSPRSVQNRAARGEIEQRIAYSGAKDGAQFFTDALAFGIAGIAAPFFPRPVIVRLSDFKSNEYRSLLGGEAFEPEDEANPMIGWRGASRYVSEKFAEAFALECAAIKRVREEMGLRNVVVMVPFVRTAAELERVQVVMARHGLVRGQHGLQIYMMAEVPSNFVAAETFCPLVDGFSIGSNDLTQLTLGLDRDSELVAHLYSEEDTAVKAMIGMLLATAEEHGKKVGICGQGPSDLPSFAKFLVDAGIGTLSVTPDAVPRTIAVLESC